MPRIHFHQSLDDLKDRLLSQAALAQQALDTVLDAYAENDLKLCQHVIDNEQAINSSEQLIDAAAQDLLAKEQPMAVDLRFIVSVIKINSDLERVGDQCVNIADRVRATHDKVRLDLPVDIPEMGRLARNMVRTAVQSLIERDVEVADHVLRQEPEVDELNRLAQIALQELMMKHPEATEQALAALLICRNLERIADHATNIAEDVIFWVRGADIRHNVQALQ